MFGHQDKEDDIVSDMEKNTAAIEALLNDPKITKQKKTTAKTDDKPELDAMFGPLPEPAKPQTVTTDNIKPVANKPGAPLSGLLPEPDGDTPVSPMSSAVGSTSDDFDISLPDPTAPIPVPGTDELLQIKQTVLEQLSPLVGKLEQSPEEKFRTTMMLIQASDNPTLIEQAYKAAMAIPDEKYRAQALLDVVNEINYFTHQPEE